ncbi:MULTISPECIES: PD-(D/E)XK nuclease family protein [unclassified Bifidobacterium]|uniref:PDDEXK-like family protein n=1 Tax=unclassified Bifidobacterium TaxID=2608897 RepID=UPI0023FA1880|nr:MULTISPECIES: PD-(D/E)XK nuclease family protein [unclassified Bifidobacterium]WEV64627.1 PD-(D/E)XK nuclease family protein [Bifidobacterium sp. ESL0732]WEV75956.1 PD-(D/E)XK nuclease family protein [Bifidobacterium sp. ESL0800]
MSENNSLASKAMELLADPDFDQLNQRLNRVNVFDAVDMGRQEIKHSAFLAWLMDPSGPHGLGDLFIHRLLAQLYVDNSEKFAESGVASFVPLAADDLSELNVVRESEDRIDILAKTIDDRMVMCIENKVDSGLHNRQLDDYHQYIESTYGNRQYRIYVLLAPEGFEIPKDQCQNPAIWLTLSYSSVAKVLESLRDSAQGRTQILIEDYVRLLKKENIVNDEEQNKLAYNLYRNYSEVFDFVSQACTDQSAVEQYLIEKVYDPVMDDLQDKGQISNHWCWNKGRMTYYGFHTQKMNDYFGATNDDWVYAYWLYPDKVSSLLKPSMRLEVFPKGKQETTIGRMQHIRERIGSGNSSITNQNKQREIVDFPSDINLSDILETVEIDALAKETKGKLYKAMDNMLQLEKRALME